MRKNIETKLVDIEWLSKKTYDKNDVLDFIPQFVMIVVLYYLMYIAIISALSFCPS